MSERICPFAIWLPGPPEKTGYSGAQKTRAKVGVTLHSMEYESEPQWEDAKTLYNTLFSAREASWTFSIVWFLNGEALFQHYPIGTVCWAQGYPGNLWLDSIELEDVWKTGGGVTEGQYRLLVKLLRWRAEVEGWRSRWAIGDRGLTLPDCGPPMVFEHNGTPGAPATQCAVFAHGQVDAQRLLADLREDDMDEATVKAIVDKALKPVLRSLELQAEAQDIRASLEFWLGGYGEPVEDARFMAFVNGYIAWRLRGKPGWVVPE
jgi:hypothetical protein